MLTKSQRAELLVAALEREYPDAQCSLDYEKPHELLVATRLAAQCTDARVNLVTPVLFGRYPTLEALAAAEVSEVAEIVAPCGLGNTKARDIVACAKKLIEDYGGVVPDELDELLKLPGVGRKTANLIVGDVYGKPAVVCDTHCIRITNLMGLASSQNPAVVEKQLREVLQPEKSNDFCHRLVLHGRRICKARKPVCESCAAQEACEHTSNARPKT
jgi:endonuclease-3